MLFFGAISKSPADSSPSWTMVDCNAGGSTQDCHVLIDSGVVAIVDTGTVDATKRYFIPYLIENQLNEIDHFFVSHPHDNHVGGLIDIIRAGINIKNIYINRPPEGSRDFAYDPDLFDSMLIEAAELGATTHNINDGDTIELGKGRIVVLNSPQSQQAEINDYSIIMRWEAGGYSTLFTGDLSIGLGAALVGNPLYSADFYKAPHHGVTPIAPDSFSDTVNPFINLIPTPRVLLQHPRGRQYREWYTRKRTETGMITCSNGENGHVTLTLQNPNVTLTPERPTSSFGCENTSLIVKPKIITPFRPPFNITPVIDQLLNE